MAARVGRHDHKMRAAELDEHAAAARKLTVRSVELRDVVVVGVLVIQHEQDVFFGHGEMRHASQQPVDALTCGGHIARGGTRH